MQYSSCLNRQLLDRPSTTITVQILPDSISRIKHIKREASSEADGEGTSGVMSQKLSSPFFFIESEKI